mgnify:CR=1 FL=1
MIVEERMRTYINSLDMGNTPFLEELEKEQLLSAVDRAMEKVVNKMLFGLRDSMNEKAFLECVAGLEKTYEK